MKITVYNEKRTSHVICKTNGQRLTVFPYSSVSFITDDEREITFWKNQTTEVLSRYGLSVSFDVDESNNVSVADGFVSPYAKQIAEQAKPQAKQAVDVKSDSDNGFYSESELLQMDKEDLFNLCNNFDIKYRKNASVKTLVAQILEATKA
jgi:hypothetical protein